jgi:hypothetical protein
MSLAAAQLRGTPWLLSQQRRPQPSLRRAVTTAALESVDFHALGVTAVDALAGTPLKLAGTLGISAASWQALVWGNREYILAAHVQNNTPPGAVVVEYGTKQVREGSRRLSSLPQLLARLTPRSAEGAEPELLPAVRQVCVLC